MFNILLGTFTQLPCKLLIFVKTSIAKISVNDNKIQNIKDDEIGARTLFLTKLNNGKHIS